MLSMIFFWAGVREEQSKLTLPTKATILLHDEFFASCVIPGTACASTEPQSVMTMALRLLSSLLGSIMALLGWRTVYRSFLGGADIRAVAIISLLIDCRDGTGRDLPSFIVCVGEEKRSKDDSDQECRSLHPIPFERIQKNYGYDACGEYRDYEAFQKNRHIVHKRGKQNGVNHSFVIRILPCTANA